MRVLLHYTNLVITRCPRTVSHAHMRRNSLRAKLMEARPRAAHRKKASRPTKGPRRVAN